MMPGVGFSCHVWFVFLGPERGGGAAQHGSQRQLAHLRKCLPGPVRCAKGGRVGRGRAAHLGQGVDHARRPAAVNSHGQHGPAQQLHLQLPVAPRRTVVHARTRAGSHTRAPSARSGARQRRQARRPRAARSRRRRWARPAAGAARSALHARTHTHARTRQLRHRAALHPTHLLGAPRRSTGITSRGKDRSAASNCATHNVHARTHARKHAHAQAAPFAGDPAPARSPG